MKICNYASSAIYKCGVLLWFFGIIVIVQTNVNFKVISLAQTKVIFKVIPLVSYDRKTFRFSFKNTVKLSKKTDSFAYLQFFSTCSCFITFQKNQTIYIFKYYIISYFRNKKFTSRTEICTEAICLQSTVSLTSVTSVFMF